MYTFYIFCCGFDWIHIWTPKSVYSLLHQKEMLCKISIARDSSFTMDPSKSPMMWSLYYCESSDIFRINGYPSDSRRNHLMSIKDHHNMEHELRTFLILADHISLNSMYFICEKIKATQLLFIELIICTGDTYVQEAPVSN